MILVHLYKAIVFPNSKPNIFASFYHPPKQSTANDNKMIRIANLFVVVFIHYDRFDRKRTMICISSMRLSKVFFVILCSMGTYFNSNFVGRFFSIEYLISIHGQFLIRNLIDLDENVFFLIISKYSTVSKTLRVIFSYFVGLLWNVCGLNISVNKLRTRFLCYDVLVCTSAYY